MVKYIILRSGDIDAACILPKQQDEDGASDTQ